ncbi:peptidylprolyl isomerase [Helcococcus sueciensis]|uniref:peptidylprolyl isomerase n=1 Tax=Helcococcus sueciensis TaxID=241555 RepID=UPI0003F73041|nr:peptidylprolyl isomerase [Helcococcus sueciensis]
MKKTRIISLLLALSLVLVACGTNSDETTDEGNTPRVVEETNETNEEEKRKEKEYTKIEDLRNNKKTMVSINGEDISHRRFYEFYDLYSSIMGMGQNLSQEITNLFIGDQIINKELKEANITVSDEEIKTEIDNYINKLGGQSEYYKYLSVLGSTEELFKENIENSLKRVKHQQYFNEKTKLTDDELNAYYEKNKDSIDNVIAKHILTKDEDTALKAIERLNKGEDFKDVANELSIDKAANAKGGELGAVKRSGYDADFVKAAFDLEENKVSSPVKTKFGYHVILVTKNNVGLEKNREEIQNALKKQKYQKDLQEKVKSSDIKFYNFDGSEIK